MRIPDPNGVWKAHPEEPRLMIRREPAETGGTYYRIVPEGTVEDYDGFTLRVKRPVQGLDLNRNFPASWRQEFEQLGAGPYPTSEPEVRAVVDFVTRHPNITGGTTFHTWSGVLLRPFEHQPDEEMHAEDLWVYQATGRKGTELTGYPHISVYHEFRYHPKSVIGGTFDWLYEHLGIFVLGGRDLVADARSRASPTTSSSTGSATIRPRTTSRCCAGATRRWAASRTFRGSRSTTRNSARSRSAAGTAFTRSPIRRRNCSSARLQRFPKWLVWQALISPKLELVHAARQPTGGGNYTITARRAEHRLAAVVRVEARARTQDGARPDRRDRIASRRGAGAGQARERSSGNSKAGRTSTRAFRSGRITT